MFKTKLSKLVVLLPLFLLLVGIFMRTIHMSHSMKYRLDCFTCVMKYVVVADFLILALLLFAFSFSVARNVYLRLMAKIFIFFIVIFYFLDIAIQQNFNRRLFFTDLSVYAIDFEPIWGHLLAISGHIWLLYMAFFLVFLLMAVYLWLKPVFSRNTSMVSILFSFILLLIYSVREQPIFISSWVLENYLQSNVSTMESTLYSEETALKVDKFNTPNAQCSTGLSQTLNVTMLIVESWSMYHSKLFSGLNDWTPSLDQIAQENTYYTAFHANGFTTNHGLISLFTPIQIDAVFENRFFRSDSFLSTWNFPFTIPKMMSANHYNTAFLTTGPLGFTNKGQWLESLGFDYVEGNKGSYYKKWPKISFQAAEDRALFERSFEWMMQAQKPYFLAIENVSTHTPYVDPVTKENSIEKVFRYTDKEIDTFYQKLITSGYFEDGILIIVSDHRTMNLTSTEEQNLFGDQSASLVPMIVVAPKLNLTKNMSNISQQSDLYFSLKHMITKNDLCKMTNETSVFEINEGAQEKCALHLRGQEKGTIDVVCKNKSGRVLMDGDNSTFIVNSGFSELEKTYWLEVIAWQRINLINNNHNNPQKAH